MKILDRIPRFLTSAVVTAGVLYLTLAPRPFGSVRIPLFEGADKVVHFMMFFAMAFAYHFDFRRGKKPVDEAQMLATRIEKEGPELTDETFEQWKREYRKNEK